MANAAEKDTQVLLSENIPMLLTQDIEPVTVPAEIHFHKVHSQGQELLELNAAHSENGKVRDGQRFASRSSSHQENETGQKGKSVHTKAFKSSKRQRANANKWYKANAGKYKCTFEGCDKAFATPGGKSI